MKLFCKQCSKVFEVDETGPAEVSCPECGWKSPRPESALAPGVVIGNDFIIGKSISKGGMGEVFEAKQISLDRPVALKVLQQEYTNDRDYVASLFREARAAARINHPNIVQAYAVGEDGGHYYFAMELIRGETLKTILRREGALAPAKAAKIIRDVASALDVAWRERKLVHQDIKPDNIMLDSHGAAKLADLGLAKTASTESLKEENPDEVLGTPQYISPEQLTGVPTDVRSDIYSLGATFYHLVTGKLPYRAANFEELAKLHDAGKLTPPKEIKPDLPEALDRIIVKMMARDISMRYQNASDLVSDLDSFLSGGSAGTAAGANRKQLKLTLPGAAPVQPAVVKPTVRAVQPAAAPAAASPKPAAVRPVVPKAAVPKPLAQPVAQPSVVTPAAAVPDGAAPVPAGKKWKIDVRKIVFIASIVLGALVVVSALGGGWFFLEKSGTVKTGIVLPLVEKISGRSFAPAPESAAASGEPAAGEPAAAGPAEAAVLTRESTLEKFDAVDLSRAEYLAKVKELLDWRMAHQAEDGELLTRVDGMWQAINAPETAKEYAELTKVKTLFSAIDEQLRCAADREKLRQAHLNRIAEAQRQIEEQRRLAEEAEQERRRRQEEVNRQAQDNARIQREAEAKKRERVAALKAETRRHLTACLAAMRGSAVSGDDAAFDAAVSEAKVYLDSATAFSPEERQVIGAFRGVLNGMPAAKKTARENFVKMMSIRQNSNIRLLLPSGKTAPLVSIQPGKLTYLDPERKPVEMAANALPDRTKAALMSALTARAGVQNCEFYFALLHGLPPPGASIPSGFWKSIQPLLK